MAVRRDEVNLIVTVNDKQAGNTLKDLNKQSRDLRRQLERIPVGTDEFKRVQKELAGINTQIRSAKEGMSGIAKEGAGVSGIFGKLGGLIGGLGIGALITAAGAVIGKLFEVGSGLEFMRQKTHTVFGEAEVIVQGFAETNAKSIGLARAQYVELATNIGDLLKPMGFTEESTAKLSSELLNQAGVLSEWTKGKVSTKEASEILNKALLGERDALNTLGIDIKDSIVQAEMKKRGLQNLTGESKRQAEALITLEQITKQSASANEAFEKNTGSAARRQAELRAQVAEVTQRLAEGFVPVVNKVYEVLVPVVNWLIKFGGRLADIWQRAETFRAIVGGVFSAIGAVISVVAGQFANLMDGIANLFEGNFKAAFNSFSQLVGSSVTVGKEIKSAFVAGFNGVKNPQAAVDSDPAKANTEGKKFARAYGDGFDSEFDKLRNNAKKTPEQVAKIAKDALDARLKEIEVGVLKEELALDTALFKKEISESEHGKRILEEKRRQYQEQILAFKQFNQEETRQSLEAQKKLLEVTQQLSPNNPAPLAPLAGRPIGPVQSQSAVPLGATIGQQTEGGIEAQTLREKFAQIMGIELENEVQRAEMQVSFLDARLAFLTNAGQQETDIYKQTLKEKEKADEDLAIKQIERDKKMAERKKAISDTINDIQRDGINIAIELLSKDEKARKKNAAAIKTLQTGQVIIDGILEVQKIWSHAADLGPIAGPILGAIQTGFALVRTVGAINRIQAQKFAVGGMLGAARIGYFGGRSHSQGGTKGYFDDGTSIEVERDEAFAIVNKRNAPLLRTISAVNAYGGHGVPFFAEGGLANINTTPAAAGGSAASLSQASMAQMERFNQAVTAFQRTVAAFPRKVKSEVNYIEIEKAGTELDNVRAMAEL